MKAVTLAQRALCARALRHYSDALIEEQAMFGDLSLAQYHDALDAKELALQFENESARIGKKQDA